MNYQDSPSDIEKWLETLSDKEKMYFDRGYVTSINGFLEHITEIKQMLLNKCMGLDDAEGENLRQQLLSRVQILDVLEKHYGQRAAVLEAQHQREYDL